MRLEDKYIAAFLLSQYPLKYIQKAKVKRMLPPGVLPLDTLDVPESVRKVIRQETEKKRGPFYYKDLISIPPSNWVNITKRLGRELPEEQKVQSLKDIEEEAGPRSMIEGSRWYSRMADSINALAEETGVNPDNLLRIAALESPRLRTNLLQQNLAKQISFVKREPELLDVLNKTMSKINPRSAPELSLDPYKLNLFIPNKTKMLADQILRGQKGALQSIRLGPKTRDFYNSLIGSSDPNTVTLDTHAFASMYRSPLGRIFLPTRSVYQPGERSIIDLKEYEASKKPYITAAKESGFHPKEYQAAIWNAIKSLHGWPDQILSPLELRKYYRENPEIRYDISSSEGNPLVVALSGPHAGLVSPKNKRRFGHPQSSFWS